MHLPSLNGITGLMAGIPPLKGNVKGAFSPGSRKISIYFCPLFLKTFMPLSRIKIIWSSGPPPERICTGIPPVRKGSENGRARHNGWIRTRADP
jgi:hypothetical protein